MNATLELARSAAAPTRATIQPQLHRPPPSRPDVITINHLRIEYRSRELGNQTKVAVNNLSLAVHAGEVFGFLGPNGAGKTSTMNVLLGFVPPTGGTANIFGVNVQQTIARQRLGYLPELTYYYKFLTAEELLRFYARIFGLERAERERRIDAVLKLVELEHARKRLIKTYSKGMQQRVGLAQALINNPDLLILDEPTSGLDPLGRMKVRSIIQRLKNEGKTVFFSSHELGEVETVCDRVAIMHQGDLRVLGRVDDLAREHQCNLEQLFLKIVGYQPEESVQAMTKTQDPVAADVSRLKLPTCQSGLTSAATQQAS